MKKLHIQEAAQVVSAWDNGTPLTALCGYSRITTEAEYEAIRDVAPTCRRCERIAQGHVNRGDAAELPKRRTAEEIRKRVARPQWHVYQVTATFEPDTFPLAG